MCDREVLSIEWKNFPLFSKGDEGNFKVLVLKWMMATVRSRLSNQ
jgi:hypothetical protein